MMTQRVIRGVLALAWLILGAAPALAQSSAWPNGPVRIVVPFAPGGVTDSSARAMSERLSGILGRPIIVENRSGGGATIGAAAVATARPDGSTFLLDTVVHVVNPLIMSGLAFDYRTAFTPVTQVARLPMVVAVRQGFPAADLASFVALARRTPGGISCGSAGNATAGHLAAARLEARGVSVLHVPYRGGSDAARDFAAGSLDCVIIALQSVAPVIQSGRGRIIAVSSTVRSSLLPDVPTVAEGGFPGFEQDEWTGLFAPAGTPAPIVRRMRDAVAEAIRTPAIVERLASLGAEPVASTPEEFEAFLARSGQDLARVVREANITAQ